MDALPNPLEADEALPTQELQNIKTQYEQEHPPRPQTKFNYAWALVRSQSRRDQQKGVDLLNEMYKEMPSRRRECLYYLALGEFKLGHYREARRLNDTLLQKEPQNIQALNLKMHIDDKVRSEGFIGMAIMGAAVATAGILTALLVRK